MTCRIVGSRGEATAPNFVQPHLDDRVIVTTAHGERVEQLGKRSSYTYQLEALSAVLRRRVPLPVDVVFPAAMSGSAVSLITGRREVVAAEAASLIGIALVLAVGPGVGIAGGLLGPAAALAVTERNRPRSADADRPQRRAGARVRVVSVDGG